MLLGQVDRLTRYSHFKHAASTAVGGASRGKTAQPKSLLRLSYPLRSLLPLTRGVRRGQNRLNLYLIAGTLEKIANPYMSTLRLRGRLSGRWVGSRFPRWSDRRRQPDGQAYDPVADGSALL